MSKDRQIRGLAIGLVLAGCAQTGHLPAEGMVPAPQEAMTRPAPRPHTGATAAAIPTADAQTAEDLDTTTRAERSAAASAPPDRPERELGRTIASLGDPTISGFWAKTPLVDAPQEGRLVYPLNGNSVLVQLRPLEADPGAGSQVSLAALRVLGAPLTGLPELLVLAR